MTETGKTEKPDNVVYDVLIIGAGPAGLSAGIYAIRSGVKTLLLEGRLVGGQLFNTDVIDNYLGFPEIKGYELAEKMEAHVRRLGLKIEMAMIKKISITDNKLKLVHTEDGRIFKSKTVIFAAGGNPRYLGATGEDRLAKRGVSYCAVCDGPFFKGQEIAVIGGGDAACEESLYLTNHASKIYIIHRRDELRAKKSIQDEVLKNEKIEVVWDSVVQSINGENLVESITLKNVKTGEESELKVTGVFIFIGFIPNTDYFEFELDKNAEGYIKVDQTMQTSVPGIYAIGDSREHIARQIAISAGDGATAALAAVKYLDLNKNEFNG